MALETHWQIMLTQHESPHSPDPLRSTLLSFSHHSLPWGCSFLFFLHFIQHHSNYVLQTLFFFLPVLESKAVFVSSCQTLIFSVFKFHTNKERVFFCHPSIIRWIKAAVKCRLSGSHLLLFSTELLWLASKRVNGLKQNLSFSRKWGGRGLGGRSFRRVQNLNKM